jgi:hypothetical protein
LNNAAAWATTDEIIMLKDFHAWTKSSEPTPIVASSFSNLLQQLSVGFQHSSARAQPY